MISVDLIRNNNVRDIKKQKDKSNLSKVLPEPQGPLGCDKLHFLSPQPDTGLSQVDVDQRTINGFKRALDRRRKAEMDFFMD